MRIGLLGGSFNPAHDAHREISLLALKRLGLDRIWWLVTPGNPLKDSRELKPLGERLQQARTLTGDPRIDVTAIETLLRTRFTFDTVRRLTEQYRGVRFVFLMGADNLAQLHRWKRWRELISLVPLAVVDREGWSLRALASPAAISMSQSRLPEHDAVMLASSTAPSWVFLHGLKSGLSSTKLRSTGSSLQKD
jgi:nicotinate-nucleotide adenylyltransferase